MSCDPRFALLRPLAHPAAPCSAQPNVSGHGKEGRVDSLLSSAWTKSSKVPDRLATLPRKEVIRRGFRKHALRHKLERLRSQLDHAALVVLSSSWFKAQRAIQQVNVVEPHSQQLGFAEPERVGESEHCPQPMFRTFLGKLPVFLLLDKSLARRILPQPSGLSAHRYNRPARKRPGSHRIAHEQIACSRSPCGNSNTHSLPPVNLHPSLIHDQPRSHTIMPGMIQLAT